MTVPDPARNASVTITNTDLAGGVTMFSLPAWEQATVPRYFDALVPSRPEP